MQRYARIEKQSLHLMKSGSIDDCHDVLCKDSLGNVQLKLFNLSEYNVVLLFLHRKNDEYS